MVYRDFAVNRWLRGKARVARYVRSVHRRYPRQRWTDSRVWPLAGRAAGAFAIWYRFEMTGRWESMTGEGMERIHVEHGLVQLDDFYLRADTLELSVPLIDRRFDLLRLGRSFVLGRRRAARG